MIQKQVETDWESTARKIAARFGPVGLPADCYPKQSAKIQHRIEFVLNRLHYADSVPCRAAYRLKFNNLKASLEDIAERIGGGAMQLVPASEVLLDIGAMQEEFSSVTFDGSSGELTAVTHPVELDGVYLGSFRIVLETTTLFPTTRGSYYITAVDPCPSASEQDVIHPHVHHGSLCEGDAMQAIRTALLQGRLFDFFQIVN